MFLFMNNSNDRICVTETISLALFHKKIVNAQSSDQKCIDDPKTVKGSAHFYRISWSKPEVSVFKNGSDIANLIKSMFCDIT